MSADQLQPPLFDTGADTKPSFPRPLVQGVPGRPGASYEPRVSKAWEELGGVPRDSEEEEKEVETVDMIGDPKTLAFRLAREGLNRGRIAQGKQPLPDREGPPSTDELPKVARFRRGGVR